MGPAGRFVAARVADELLLVSWVRSQLDLCSATGSPPIVAGDLDSVGSLFLDCQGSSLGFRPSSLVPTFVLEGHQKLAGRAAMTFAELTLRTAGGGCSC